MDRRCWPSSGKREAREPRRARRGIASRRPRSAGRGNSRSGAWPRHAEPARATTVHGAHGDDSARSPVVTRAPASRRTSAPTRVMSPAPSVRSTSPSRSIAAISLASSRADRRVADDGPGGDRGVGHDLPGHARRPVPRARRRRRSPQPDRRPRAPDPSPPRGTRCASRGAAGTRRPGGAAGKACRAAARVATSSVGWCA